LPPRDWRLRVEDILDAADRIDQYVEGLDSVRFQADRKTVDAVVRNLEVIAEAATHLARVQDELPSDIPWADVSGIRNILIHEYFGVDLGIVWQTITVDLPLLRTKLLSVVQRS
jgi:uncharacterized protein with HEPN domain